jgi:SAM-dependent methyltransferase
MDYTTIWENNEADYSGDTTAPEIIRLSKKYIKGKVLDIGAGSGKLLQLLNLNRKVESIWGIDIAPKRSFIFEGSISEIDFDKDIFDTIFATDILEHLSDGTLREGLKEVYRVLKPNGKFIIVVPNDEDFRQSEVCCPGCEFKFHRWGHMQKFDLARMYSLLSLNGFAVIEHKIIPLSLMAEHWLIRHFTGLFVKLGFARANDMFVVASK